MLNELDWKKIALGIVLIVLGLVLFFGIFWLVFLRDEPDQTGPTNGGGVVLPGGSLPEIGSGDGRIVGQPGRLIGEGGDERGSISQPTKTAQGSFTQVEGLIKERVDGITFNQGGFRYLSGQDNRFYYIDKNGQTKYRLSDDEFPFVEKVVWAPDGNKVILEYPDGANIVYDFEKNKKTSLPTGGEDFVFDKESRRIGYKFIGSSKEDNWLVVSQANNTNSQAVEPIGDRGHSVQVSWSPDSQVVALYHKPTGIDSEEVFFLGLNNENFRSLKVRGSNFEGKWSPSGDKILYHTVMVNNDYNPVLWITDGNLERLGSNNFNLGLSTWVDKCTFSPNNREVYCAVPIQLGSGAGLYPDLVNDSGDVFYRINLVNGVSEMIAYPVLSEDLDKFQVKNLFIDERGEKLYFWDNLTKKVYFMNLK